MRVIGIDISTKKIACVILDSNSFRVVEFTSKQKTWDSRLDDLQSQFWEFVETEVDKERDFIFIEEIPFVQNRQAVIRLVHVLAMCRTGAVRLGSSCTYVNVNVWMQRGVGKGNASKEDIANKAISLYGERVHSLNQDCWDALLIATYGLVSRLYEEWAKQEGSLKEHFKGVVK